METHFEINNIINHINSIKKGTHNKKGICVLIGAGADISSGGVLFRDLKLLFLKENGCTVPANISDKLLSKQFNQQLDKFSQDGRCETLDKIMRKHCKPSEGYLLLVMLAELGYIDAVITTNFDYLLEETQDLLNLYPFTIYTPGKSIPGEYYLNRSNISPVYLKMHGDLSDRLVTHLTLSEIQNKQYGNEFIKLFKHIIQNNSILIVGYGGYDNLITEIFAQEIDCISAVFWCNICGPQKDSDLVKLLQQKNKLYYVNTSFDKLFQKLAKTFLKSAKFKNVNPIFLPTVVQSKIENQKAIFTEKIKYLDKLIIRSAAQNALESFLQTFDNKCIAIIGEEKFGKSCFVYKAMQLIQDITFFPIACENKNSILENMTQALGYDTDVPFSVMYSFLKWWNDRKEHLVFVMDDFFCRDYFKTISTNYVIEFLNFIYIAQEFKYVQFIICFQSNIYSEFERNGAFTSLRNIISEKIEIGKFSESEVIKLLEKNGIKNNLQFLKKQELLHVPYVWDILSKNNVSMVDDTDFFTKYIDNLYDIASQKYNFTKHALKTTLMKLAYNQLFNTEKQVGVSDQECTFLKEEGIIDQNNEIVYPEMATYFCKKNFLNSSTWEEVTSEIIIPNICAGDNLSDIQMEVYISILAEVENIDKYDILLKNLENIILGKTTDFQGKIVVKILHRCFEISNELFKSYLTNIDINTYSSSLQYYLFRTCAELAPDILSAWEMDVQNDKLSYAAFILGDDILYELLKAYSKEKVAKDELLIHFMNKNGLIKSWHMLTYWGWDNLSNTEYMQLMNIVTNEVLPVVVKDESSVKYFVDVLKKYAYNIFFNAGGDFEEQFIRSKNMIISELIEKVLNRKMISNEEYLSLLKVNTDINNSWIFIISNIIVVKAMYNYPNETYEMLYHFFDNIQFDVQVQHLDFFLSSAFWSLYLNEPCDRKKFETIFEKIAEKYERILFMFPNTPRKASFNKFSEEFDRMFEDGFNPIAFYFYTAPYQTHTDSSVDWNKGKSDLKVYWDWVQCMLDLGKYDDMLRIVHALGQMISIYPIEGYSAMENLANIEQPIIKRGIVRIFKENYLRYSSITKEELKKSIYHFESGEVEEIKYNNDFLLENRTLEQLHWGRLFYNLEQLFNINISEIFLRKVLCSHSCSAFLHNFITSLAGDI